MRRGNLLCMQRFLFLLLPPADVTFWRIYVPDDYCACCMYLTYTMQQPFVCNFDISATFLSFRNLPCQSSTAFCSERCIHGFRPDYVIMRSQMLALICVFPYLATALHPNVIVRQAAAAPPPDPCGPKIQNQAGQPTNTCNGTGIPATPATAPSIYAAYLDDNIGAVVYPPQHSGSPNTPSAWARACKTSINYLCNDLTLANLGQWTSNNFGVSCSAQVWVDDPKTGAQFPSPYHCMNDIFFPMLAMLDNGGATSHINRASINIPIGGFPNANGAGSQIDSGYPSWILQLYVKALIRPDHLF